MTDPANKPSATTLARDNLKKGFGSPVAKIGMAVGGLVIVGGGLLAGYMFRSNSLKGGPANVGGLGISVETPRGGTDASTTAAVEAANNEKAAQASKTGGSFAGPFVYAAEGSTGQPRPDAPPPGANPDVVKAGMEGVSAATPVDVSPVVMALRKSAAEYDASDAAMAKRGDASTAGARSGGTGSAQGGGGQARPGLAEGYGWSPDDFKKVADQLSNVGMRTVSYESLPNGVLSRAAPSTSVSNLSTGTPDARMSASATANVRAGGEVLAARGGSICPAEPETILNTDYNVPVFVKLLDCGVLTNSRLRGTIVRGPDDFTLRFSNVFFDPQRRIKLVGTFDGVAVNVDKDGAPGVADNVDNHWFSRLASSSLLALARTEKQFITNRGSSIVNTGTSSTTTIDPLTAEQKRDARIGAVLEGGLDVVSRDLGVGVNRQATMTTKKNKLIAVQFLDDIKVTQIE